MVWWSRGSYMLNLIIYELVFEKLGYNSQSNYVCNFNGKSFFFRRIFIPEKNDKCEVQYHSQGNKK